MAAVLGAGSWGTALACLLASKGRPVRLWARSREAASRLTEDRENRHYLPGVAFPPELEVTSRLENVIESDVVFEPSWT